MFSKYVENSRGTEMGEMCTFLLVKASFRGAIVRQRSVHVLEIFDIVFQFLASE